MTASKAGFCELMTSSIVCVIFVSWVNVERCDLKPCCEGDKLMCGVMLFRTSLSSILEGLQRRDMGL